MRRALVGELMDDPGLDPVEHARALRGLDRLNRLGATASIVGRAVEGVLKGTGRSAERSRENGQAVRLLDVACGGGAVGVSVARWLERRGWVVRLVGCDVSETALRSARATADAAGLVGHRWVVADATAGGLPACDVAVCGLFLHHLEEADAVAVLRGMSEAADAGPSGGGGVVLDLLRTRRGLAMVWLTCRLVTRCRVVHVDGPRSVRAAYTVAELAGLAERAGLGAGRGQKAGRVAVRRVFGQRAVLTWGGGARVTDDA
ncbi:MAG: methyltransferase domain-containing protein [Planctomycetota bacterium]